MNPNKAILQCPDCKKPLVNIASRVERIHPVARFIKNHDAKIIFTWAIFITYIVFFVGFGGGGTSRSIGFGWVALLMVPSVITYFLTRLFPIYRITDCPYCGYHHKQKLGHSMSPDG